VRAATALIEGGRYRAPSLAGLDEAAIMDRLLKLYRRLAAG
jgi:hypothetical protein